MLKLSIETKGDNMFYIPETKEEIQKLIQEITARVAKTNDANGVNKLDYFYTIALMEEYFKE